MKRPFAPTRIHSAAIWIAAAALLPLGAWGCRDSAPDDLIQEEPTTDALVFVKTVTEETLNRTWADGNLYKLSPIAPDGVVTPITSFIGASISDPCVSFDGKKILFSMRPPGGANRNIWEIGTDGTGLRQVTSGGGHDFDPLYMPDGKIVFTSSRDGEMDEYNHAPSEHLYTCNGDGTSLERISYNQSDDFDPELLPDGRLVYTRWEHFGTMNRFPLFFTHPDGSGTFHMFGPHDRNFFHAVPTPDGHVIAIESNMVEEDAGPIAMLKPEEGPADPANGAQSLHWDRLTTQVNLDGAPWPYGAFKYPRPLGGNTFVASYTLPSATDEEVDYGLYTFTIEQNASTFSIKNLTFLYNDPNTNEYDAQLIAPHSKPPVIASTLDRTKSYGTFLAQDVFNRGMNDGQERPVKGVDPIGQIAVLTARPTMAGEMNDFSANEFEKRALIGFAPVYADGSFKIDVPANTPISFATLDTNGRGFVVKRTHLYVRPGEVFDRCVGCHEDRLKGGPVVTNVDPQAAMFPAHNLNVPSSSFTVINYQNDIGPIVQAKCQSCHTPTIVGTDTTAAAGNLDLSNTPTTTRMNRTFPRGYVSLSGESMSMAGEVVVPPFPRRSKLVDYVMGLGTHAGSMHPAGADTLTADERQKFNLWVLLGAQYK